MAASDNNVRPGRRVPAATALGTRHFALARLLLFVLRLAQLDRKLLLLLAALPMSACIIPFGPEFQDPDGRANSAPEILGTDPIEGSEVTGMNFSVTAKDANAGDMLHFRWIADWPGALYRVPQRDDKYPPPMNGGPQVQRSPWMLDCVADHLDPSLTSHRLTVIVADRDFIETTDSADLAKVEPPGKSVRTFWIWNHSCATP